MCRLCDLDSEKCERCGTRLVLVDVDFMLEATGLPVSRQFGQSFFELVPLGDMSGRIIEMVPHSRERCTAFRAAGHGAQV